MKQLVKIYSASWCQPCKSAKRLLTERGLKYEEIDIEERGWSREDLIDLTGGRTVPQIVIDGSLLVDMMSYLSWTMKEN